MIAQRFTPQAYADLQRMCLATSHKERCTVCDTPGRVEPVIYALPNNLDAEMDYLCERCYRWSDGIVSRRGREVHAVTH